MNDLEMMPHTLRWAAVRDLASAMQALIAFRDSSEAEPHRHMATLGVDDLNRCIARLLKPELASRDLSFQDFELTSLLSLLGLS